MLTWTCTKCEAPIADGEGYFAISNDEIATAEAWRSAPSPEDGSLPMLSYANLPTPARWEVLHRACDGVADRPDYWFDVAEVRTPERLIRWTAHLLESKNWLGATDWDWHLSAAASQL